MHTGVYVYSLCVLGSQGFFAHARQTPLVTELSLLISEFIFQPKLIYNVLGGDFRVVIIIPGVTQSFVCISHFLKLVLKKLNVLQYESIFIENSRQIMFVTFK